MIAAPVQAGEMMSRAILPGAALVNILPFCAVFSRVLIMASYSSFSVRYVPSWVPCLSYEPLAQKARRLNEKMKNDPINFVKNAMVRRGHSLSTHVDRPYISTRGLQSNPWRASIYKRRRIWLVQSATRRKRLSRLLWAQCLQVWHHIRRSGLYTTLTGILRSWRRHCGRFLSNPHSPC